MSESWHGPVKSIINLLRWSHHSWDIVHVKSGCVKCQVTQLVVFDTIRVDVVDVLAHLDVTELNKVLEIFRAVQFIYVLSQLELDVLVILQKGGGRILLDVDVSFGHVKLSD